MTYLQLNNNQIILFFEIYKTNVSNNLMIKYVKNLKIFFLNLIAIFLTTKTIFIMVYCN